METGVEDHVFTCVLSVVVTCVGGTTRLAGTVMFIYVCC